MLPPSVNSYVRHKAQGVHVKSEQARAWERDFPLFSRGQFIVGKRFAIALDYTFGPNDRGDIDNFNKLVLDCVAKSGMLRDAKGHEVSDAWFKRMVVEIDDANRHLGPNTRVTIETIE
jgi:Holliday junction resolvase RusA-like endonuclease